MLLFQEALLCSILDPCLHISVAVLLVNQVFLFCDYSVYFLNGHPLSLFCFSSALPIHTKGEDNVSGNTTYTLTTKITARNGRLLLLFKEAAPASWNTNLLLC